jgi:hypothetical protein
MEKTKKTKINWFKVVGILVCVFFVILLADHFRSARQREVLKKIITRLEADSRIAQVFVTEVSSDPATNRALTTIKFLEYDSQGRALKPRYFTFAGNIIQFQSLVVRFEDFYIERGDAVRGKSVYLFLKVFFLNGPKTQVYDITPVYQVPEGYQLLGLKARSSKIEQEFWEKFWGYALKPEEAKKVGIKSAQIEAPGTKFVPGTLYTIKIEHDGGMRIDAEPLPDILKGEKVPF